MAVDVLFPSNILSGPGVAVDKTNAVWSVGLDYVETSIPTTSGFFVAVWDAALSRYEKVRLYNLNLPTLVDFRSPIGDANYAVSVKDRYLGLTAPLTAIRTITLPAAATLPPGRQLVLKDEVGGVLPSFYHSIVPTSTDTRSAVAPPGCKRRSEAGSCCARTARTPATCSSAPSKGSRCAPTASGNRPSRRSRPDRQHADRRDGAGASGQLHEEATHRSDQDRCVRAHLSLFAKWRRIPLCRCEQVARKCGSYICRRHHEPSRSPRDEKFIGECSA
jgi:hypothetical protein